MSAVVTYIEVQPSFTADAIVLLTHYRSINSTSPGNRETTVVQEMHRSNRFVTVEVWEDESSFQNHENATQIAEFRSKLRSVHSGPYDQRVHHDFAVGPASGFAGGDSIWVITHVDVPPPRREETEILLKRLAEQSRTDSGCGRYDIFQQNAPRTNHFTVVALWSDEGAFWSHNITTRVREFREALGPMLGAPYDERLFRRVR